MTSFQKGKIILTYNNAIKIKRKILIINSKDQNYSTKKHSPMKWMIMKTEYFK